MLNILIVDDEYRDRRGMSNIINRQGWDVTTFEANCGQAAVSVLESRAIDIMITDIRMPDMLGTELAETAVKLHPNIKTIFISAHRDFEYAQQALRSGVVNYLLKPYLIEDFIASIEAVVNKCLYEKSELPENAAPVTDQLFKDNLFSCFLKDPENASVTAELEKQIGGFQNGVQPIIIEILNHDMDMTRIPLRQILESSCGQAFHFFRLNNRRCLILLTDQSRFFPNDTLAKRLTDQFSESGNTEICVVYGKTVLEAGELLSVYDLILSTLEVCFFTETSVVLPAGDGDFSEYENNPPIAAVTDRIAFSVHSKDYDSVLSDIKFLFDYFKRHNHMSALYVKYICSNIINRIFLNINAYDVETQMQKYLKKVFDTQSVNDIYNVFEELITEIRNHDDDYENSRIINNVYHIIETEYMTDLTLESVAQRLYFSASYLSHLFKKETNQNFIDYIKNYRLKKSCELLKNTNLRISQICTKIGYESTSYYCALFKSTYGMTPTQYRKRSGKKHG